MYCDLYLGLESVGRLSKRDLVVIELAVIRSFSPWMSHIFLCYQYRPESLYKLGQHRPSTILSLDIVLGFLSPTPLCFAC